MTFVITNACCNDGACVQRYIYGNALSPGLRIGEGNFIDVDIDGDEVRGPAGKLRLTQDVSRDHHLRPGWCIERGNNPGFVLGLRAYLARFPDSLWAAPTRAILALGLGRGARIVVESRSFEHVLGKGRGRWRIWIRWH